MPHDGENRFEDDLRARLEQFAIDDPTAERPFTVRLAQENGWSEDFTSRAVEEYRKFLFLAVTCEHPAVPSEVVERVWRLHLIYTRSYWDRLCREVLGRPLHHNPHPGVGPALEERQRHYLSTLASYSQLWGEPPAEIWPKLKDGKQKNVPERRDPKTIY